ncbi:MAG: SDR family oxidoreductase [Bacteroidota bacterium]|jgi:NADP-dependent 3-hydroxy acid dehydrogenase YdfG|nr:SDR family oxidoreductase [Sphingobacteriales bacterium]
MNLSGKIAVVTGVSKGIGLAVANALLQKQCVVYGLGRNGAEINHPDFHFIKTDVRHAEEVKKAISQIASEQPRIDILINNAGLGYFGFLEDISDEQWHEMFETNVDGMFYCCKAVLPHMKKNQFGHIINIASTAALEGMPQVSAYCATKWAVKGLSESLFREVRDYRIKVSCVYPGSTKTDFFRNSPGIQPHDYMLMPDDIALMLVQALEMPDNFHTVNLEIRPLQPKGPKTT